MALIPKATPMVGSVANVKVPRAEQQVISKEDVELIRKLVSATKDIESPKDAQSAQKSATPKLKPPRKNQAPPNTMKSSNSAETSPETSGVPVIKHHIKTPIQKGRVVEVQKGEVIDHTQSSSDFAKLNPTPEQSRIRTMHSTQHSRRDTVGKQVMFSIVNVQRTTKPPSIHETSPHPTLSTALSSAKRKLLPYVSLRHQKADEKKEMGVGKEKLGGNIDKKELREVAHERRVNSKEAELRNTQRTEEQPLLTRDEDAVYKPPEHRSKLEERSQRQSEVGKEKSKQTLSLSESADHKAMSQLNTIQKVMDVQVAKEKKA
ncbi:hypothetical protein ANCCAN_13822 [Ancylostoma caninum]|uniref:Uncharacterized protein n=1 Tax=Ancylostoma caninum TaxID=29170 RepID=A0A368G725_ANCCA|nr:hypothetical protein ANCCAN_13822 [Ancylostoma caninum]